MLTKLTPIETASEIIYQRHIIQKLRREMTYTRRPDLVQNGIDHARLALKCAYRGYMYTIRPPPDTLTGRTVKRPDPIHPAPPGRTTTKSERKYLP